MPRVYYNNGKKIEQKSMMAPKKYTDLGAWLKKARKTIPAIPDWPLFEDPTVTKQIIIFKLEYPGTGARCVVIIDRTPE